MPIFTVLVNRTVTVEKLFEMEISAKDEESAQEKAKIKIDIATEKNKLEKFDWQESSYDENFEYEVSEQ